MLLDLKKKSDSEGVFGVQVSLFLFRVNNNSIIVPLYSCNTGYKSNNVEKKVCQLCQI